MRFILACLLTMSLVSTAAAQPSLTPPQQADREPEVETYGGWVLGTGGAGLVLMLLGAASEGDGGRDSEATEAFYGFGMLGYLLSGPIVHGAKGEVGRAFGSLALRVAIPMVTSSIAMSMADCDDTQDWFCELDYMGPGLFVGAAAATVIDAIWLAKREREPAGRFVTPYAAPTRGGAALGLSGSF